MPIRKAVKVYVPTWYLLQLFTQDKITRETTTVQGVPEDAILAASGYDYTREETYFIFTHETFKEIPEGAEIPELRIVLQNAN